MTVPVHIVAGFLGAGKTTTLLDALARRSQERAAVIVNDFGEASLDATRFELEAGVQIADIPGSCVCCTAPEGFSAALTRLLDEVAPDRIYVEPTGLARPADLVDTLRRGPWKDRIALGPVVVIVDPAQLVANRAFLREQAEAADVLVANRVDLASAEDLAAFRDWAAELWPGPLRIVETSHGVLPFDALQWSEGEGPRRRFSTAEGAHQTGHVARSWTWPPEQVFARERLADVLARLATGRAGAELARFKGLVRTEQGCFRVEVAAGAVDERQTAYRRDSRLDVILRGDDPSPLDVVGTWLDQALVTPDEQVVDERQIEFVRPDGTRLQIDRRTLANLPNPVPDVSVLLPKRSGEAARLGELFELAGVPVRGEVVVVASDGFATAAVPADALHAAVILHSVDGEALPADKGGPFRLLIPGDAGPAGACSNVKGVVKLVVRDL